MPASCNVLYLLPISTYKSWTCLFVDWFENQYCRLCLLGHLIETMCYVHNINHWSRLGHSDNRNRLGGQVLQLFKMVGVAIEPPLSYVFHIDALHSFKVFINIETIVQRLKKGRISVEARHGNVTRTLIRPITLTTQASRWKIFFCPTRIRASYRRASTRSLHGWRGGDTDIEGCPMYDIPLNHLVYFVRYPFRDCLYVHYILDGFQ